MKRMFPMILLFALLLCVPVRADELTLDAPSALLMEKQTGTVLFAKDEHTPREPASVTKVMTLLLTMEAIDSGALSYDDTVTGSAHAASMGGSQIWLKEGEQMRVEDLIKAVCVVSGNDAAVALGEHLAGSEEAFVARMNERAKELGMNDTHFVNCTGLPADGHVTSAYDIALMSRELIWRHPDIRRFTTIWMDSLRGGASMLVNTNKLVRFYPGATGLKTGSTDSAKYCISATAEKDGMELIAVILGGSTSDKRFTDAKALLNYGFAAYSLVTVTPEAPLPALPVTLGTQKTVQSRSARSIFSTQTARRSRRSRCSRARAYRTSRGASFSAACSSSPTAGRKLSLFSTKIAPKLFRFTLMRIIFSHFSAKHAFLA